MLVLCYSRLANKQASSALALLLQTPVQHIRSQTTLDLNAAPATHMMSRAGTGGEVHLALVPVVPIKSRTQNFWYHLKVSLVHQYL